MRVSRYHDSSVLVILSDIRSMEDKGHRQLGCDHGSLLLNLAGDHDGAMFSVEYMQFIVQGKVLATWERK